MKTSNIKHVPAWAAVAALGLLSACSTVDVSSGPGFSAADGLAVLPIANYTETPEAGQRARSIAQSILYQKGFTGLQQYPQDETTDLLMASGADRMQQQAPGLAGEADAHSLDQFEPVAITGQARRGEDGDGVLVAGL